MEKDYQLIKKELEKVEKANLGEVILFDLTYQYIDDPNYLTKQCIKDLIRLRFEYE